MNDDEFVIVKPNAEKVTISYDLYNKLLQDSITLARIKEYINNLDKQ